jgi:DNA-binding response OmpR family regulator
MNASDDIDTLETLIRERLEEFSRREGISLSHLTAGQLAAVLDRAEVSHGVPDALLLDFTPEQNGLLRAVLAARERALVVVVPREDPKPWSLDVLEARRLLEPLMAKLSPEELLSERKRVWREKKRRGRGKASTRRFYRKKRWNS